MFTGIVEALGLVTDIVRAADNMRLTIASPQIAPGLKLGDSIAINGTCLTAVELTATSFAADAVPETLAKTNLGDLVEGSQVNLERPMRADGRFDGHIVQGHVDSIGTVVGVDPEGDGRRISIEVADPIRRYIVDKGSVTVDGVSLTVAALAEHGFQIALIPHTLEVTILGQRQIGDRVNIEIDVIAKYVERLVGERT
ncbi:MAG: riboflavin synthase [Acidimicrobiia bacterium]|nr:riboflavin synthase [Acidimicrobiia bacterium]MDH5505211.1 riboflavin synthase [Acidimicrobiia bacterium]